MLLSYYVRNIAGIDLLAMILDNSNDYEEKLLQIVHQNNRDSVKSHFLLMTVFFTNGLFAFAFRTEFLLLSE